MRYKKFGVLALVLLSYITIAHILFSGTLTETMTNKPIGGVGGSSGGGKESIGVSDSLTVVITRAVQKQNYYGFLSMPTSRGDFSMASMHTAFFYAFFPILTVAFVLWEWSLPKEQRFDFAQEGIYSFDFTEQSEQK